MTSQTSVIRWLSIRVRIACAIAFVLSCFAPPYVSRVSLAMAGAESSGQQFLLVEDGFVMKSSALTQQGQRRAYSEAVIHTVKEGDSIERLAQRYGISTDTIRWANNLKEGDGIHPGNELTILPVSGVLHSVKSGQTLGAIADLYDIPIETIKQQNRLKETYLLAGQELIIPSGKPIVQKPTVVAAKPPKQPTVPAGKKPAVTPPVVVAKETPDPTLGVLQKPCSAECFITQYYNPSHYALDLQERGGGPIYAAEAGTVTRADYGWDGGYGNVIEIDHGNELVTLYGHNKELYVKAGDTVKRGQLISWMGNTGLVHGPTGIHLHFEVRVKGVKKNPLLYIEE